MTRTKYLTINESSIYTDALGNPFPDIFTFPINRLKINDTPLLYALTQSDIYRFDILISTYYGSADYDDLVLWYNKIEHIADVLPGTTIQLPSKSDLDKFYGTYMK